MTSNVNKDLMPLWQSWGYEIIISAIPLLTPTLLGWLFGYPIYGLLLGLTVWVGIRLGNDLRVVPKQEFWVIERFGKLRTVSHEGLNFFLLLGLIDKIEAKDTLAYQSFRIYGGERDTFAEIDFMDASAPVTADVWFTIGDPNKKDSRNWKKAIRDDLICWTYAYGEPLKRIQEIADGFMRPRLQKLTMDQAQVDVKNDQGQTLSHQITTDPEVENALKELGGYLDLQKPFILSDIDIPQELKNARNQRLISAASADADIETGRGIQKAVKAIQREFDDKITYQEAIQVFLNRTGQQTIAGLENANLKLISPDLGGLVQALNTQDGDK